MGARVYSLVRRLALPRHYCDCTHAVLAMAMLATHLLQAVGLVYDGLVNQLLSLLDGVDTLDNILVSLRAGARGWGWGWGWR